MEIIYAPKAKKQLSKLNRETQKRIAEKMRFYSSQKDPIKHAEHLTDHREGEYRFRIGNYRVTFDVKRNTIFVLKIARRDKVYD